MNLDPSFSPSAHVNPNIIGMRPSATVAINERSDRLRAEGRHIYKLGLGQSPFPVPPNLVRALQDNAHQKDYLPVKGLPALRQAIAGYYRRHEGLDYDPENILVGPGSKELMFLVQLSYVGDLIIPSPSWVSYAPQARIIGRPIHWLPTSIESGLGVTPEVLEAICARNPQIPRLLILNYPGNPTGLNYPVAQLQAIAEVARRYRVVLLSDEIYGGLDFAGEHVSIARFYPEGTIISNGLSKWCGAGGWRLGAFAFPESLTWLLDAMRAVASETYTSTAAPIQYAAIEGFVDAPETLHYLEKARAILAGLTQWMWQALTEVGAEVIRPQGGFYLFPNFEPLRERLLERGIADGATLVETLLEDTGVACLPGEVFGRPREELTVRIACVDFDGGAALEGLTDPAAVDEAYLRRCCGSVMDAIERMVAWLRR